MSTISKPTPAKKTTPPVVVPPTPPVSTISDVVTVTDASSAPPKKRIVIAVPGEKFSYNFLMSWTTTLHALWESGKYELVISPGTSSFLTFARMQTLGVDVRRGKDQKPFNGNMDYFAYLTIDPNIVFNAQSVLELLAALELQPVVAGYYALPDGKSFSAARDFDTSFFVSQGGFKCLDQDTLKEWKEKYPENPFMSVAYTGLGFFGMRKEVLEAMKYPYFDAPLQKIFNEEGLEIIDMASDDTAFCKNIQHAGYIIHLHTGLRVGNEMSIVL